MRHRALALAALAAVTATPALLAPARAAKPALHVVRDGEAGRMTRLPKNDEFQADTTIEPSIAVNPANARNAVVGFQAGRGDGAASNGYGVTFDAGRHWSYGLLPKLTGLTGGPFTSASDPVIAFGPENTVYFSSLAFNASTSAIVNHTSHDGGRHWDAPTYVLNNPGELFDDKNWVVVDNGTGPGHHTGRVYVVWDTGRPVFASYSDDQGRTWLAAPSVVHPGQGIGTIPLVLPNGDLAVVYSTGAWVPPVDTNTPPDNQLATNANGQMVIAVARGAGTVPTGAPLVFGPSVTVGNDLGNAVQDLRAGGLPSASVDARTGRIAVTWEDARYRQDAANDVVVTTSTDGVRWTTPVRVNRGAANDDVDHFTPAVATGPDGVLRLAYRQRAGSSNGESSPYVDTMLQQSADGGRTWSAPLRVNRVRTDLRYAAFSRNAAFLGDYMQVAAAGAFTYVVRCEAMRLSARDTGSMPPEDTHHQRTWVALVGPAGRTL
jgi:hypothetical protein